MRPSANYIRLRYGTYSLDSTCARWCTAWFNTRTTLTEPGRPWIDCCTNTTSMDSLRFKLVFATEPASATSCCRLLASPTRAPRSLSTHLALRPHQRHQLRRHNHSHPWRQSQHHYSTNWLTTVLQSCTWQPTISQTQTSNYGNRYSSMRPLTSAKVHSGSTSVCRLCTIAPLHAVIRGTRARCHLLHSRPETTTITTTRHLATLPQHSRRHRSAPYIRPIARRTRHLAS